MHPPDLQTRSDIERLINAFYDKVKADPGIGYIFNDIARVNWPHHLPIMYDFWESVLFSNAVYKGNPMQVHFELNRKVALSHEHFETWLSLFDSSVDELFSGSNADLLKQKARSIAWLMEYKLQQSNPGGISIHPA